MSKQDPVVGRTIVSARPMTPEELAYEDWWGGSGIPTVALVLDNGTVLYPSRDPEGNGPGALFGVEPDGTCLMIEPPREGT